MTRLRIILAGPGIAAAIGALVAASPALAQNLTPEQELARLSPAAIKLLERRISGKKRALKAPVTVAATPFMAAVPTVTQPTVIVAPRRFNLLNKNTPTIRALFQQAADEARIAAPVPGAPPAELSPCPGVTLLLRQDWKDIALVGCPETTDKAKGAELSYSYDRVAANQNWTLRGTAGAFYTTLLDTPGLYHQSYGAYVTVNRVLNSSPSIASKSDSDKVAFGGVGEWGIQTANLGSHFFRIRGGAVDDRLKDVQSGNVTAEWIPVYAPLYIHRPFPVFDEAMILRFDPVLLVQYASVVGKNQVLDFNGMQQALRIGPQFTLRIWPGPNTNEFFSRFSGAVSYHWAYETYSSRGISWFDSAITYNIDPEGQFGITGSYRKGRDEDTGTLTDIYKIALTGKI